MWPFESETYDDAKIFQTLLEGVVRSGVRAIIRTGQTIPEAGVVPPDIYLVDDVPYHWLFPRVAAVVHHGGAGTTAAALRAGIPSIFVPFVDSRSRT